MNTSGITPLDQRVLVRPDPVETRTKGGIILTDTKVEKDRYATVKGTLIAAGLNAWAEARQTNGFTPPEPGSRIMIAKYAGTADIKGADGEEYRLLNDEDVVAILTEEANG